MNLSFLDLSVFVLFYLIIISLSLYKSRHEKNSEDYFLASRSLPWWVIGISIVAANISTEQFVGMAGQGAGGVGLAVSNWQLAGSIGIVVIAFTLLPRFLKAGIYTIPEFLEYRYNMGARAVMALFTVIIYVAVLLPAVLYSGGLTLETVFEIPLHQGVWMIGLIAALYTVWGGLKAVAWADLLQGVALLLGGLLMFWLGLAACGGWSAFASHNSGKLHMVLPASHEGLPWTGVVSGLWIVILYYCGLNQFIVQRTLAAKSLRDGQLGVIFAGALWLLVPFAIVMPGIMAYQLFGDQLIRPDQALPMMLREVIPSGLRGFMFAALAGAVISSLASMLNSAATVFTMDLYNRLLDRTASQRRLVFLGRGLTMLFVLLGCWIAPELQDPKFGGVFQFIQQFQGYLWPGVVAVFLFGILVPETPGSAGVVGLIAGPILYGIFQYFAGSLHFLIQVALVFQSVLLLMSLMTLLMPLKALKPLPVREEMNVTTEPIVKWIGGAVIGCVIFFYIVFW